MELPELNKLPIFTSSKAKEFFPNIKQEYFEWPNSKEHLNEITGNKCAPIQLKSISIMNQLGDGREKVIHGIQIHLITKVGKPKVFSSPKFSDKGTSDRWTESKDISNIDINRIAIAHKPDFQLQSQY